MKAVTIFMGWARPGGRGHPGRPEPARRRGAATSDVDLPGPGAGGDPVRAHRGTGAPGGTAGPAPGAARHQRAKRPSGIDTLPRKPGPPRPRQGAREPHWNDGTRPQGVSLLLPLPPQSAGAPGGTAGPAPGAARHPRAKRPRGIAPSPGKPGPPPAPTRERGEPHWNDGTRPQGASLLLPLIKGEQIGKKLLKRQKQPLCFSGTVAIIKETPSPWAAGEGAGR